MTNIYELHDTLTGNRRCLRCHNNLRYSNVWPSCDLYIDLFDLQNLFSSSVNSTTSSTKVRWNSIHWFV